MKAVLIAFLVGFAAVGAYASCANSCSGHGRCEANDKCNCYANFMGVDCSLRKCPYGTAFADEENAAGVHGYSECSNNGVCDREAGECVCGAGFTGAACDRNTCPNDCSGHGRCTFVEDMTSKQYSDWDKNQARGCKCDPYFTGPDCSLRKCPVGDDVLTTEVECGGISNGMQVNEVQKITVSADQMLSGEITLGFTDMYGQTWTTRPISVGGDNKYSILQVTADTVCLTYAQPSMYSTDNSRATNAALMYNELSTNKQSAATGLADWTVTSTGVNVDAAACTSFTTADAFKGFTNTDVQVYGSTNTNMRRELEIASFGGNYRHTMGEIGTLAAKTSAKTTVTNHGDHSSDIENALTELPYNVIPSVTVSKSTVSVDAPDATGNIYKQEYLVTFDDAANTGDQNMLTCNAAACDEDGCSPRTSGVTHDRIFSATNNLIGTSGKINSVGQGGFKIKISNVGSVLLKTALSADPTTGTDLKIKDYIGGTTLQNKYVKVDDEWMKVTNAAGAHPTDEATDAFVTYVVARGQKGTTTAAHGANSDVLVQNTVPTSYGTWTVCRPMRDSSKSCASFPGSSSAADVQTALRTITGWEGVTVTAENELLWVDQTYVVTYAAGYDDGGVEPTVDAYLIAADNTGVIESQLNQIKVGDSGVAEVKFSTLISGMDHTDADDLTGHVYVGGSGCDLLFADGSSGDGKVKTGVMPLVARSEYYLHQTTAFPAAGQFLFATGASFHESTATTASCAGNSIVPIAPYISDVKFSNSIYIAKDLNTITLETTFMYNKHTHKAGIFPSTKMAVGDKLTVMDSGATDYNKVFTVTSFERNTAGVEFAKVWPAPSTANDMGKLRIQGNNGTSFSRSHGSIKVFRQEVVEVALSDASAAATTLSQGYWRIGVNGAQTELLNPQATATDVAAGISKLSGVTGLVTVSLGSAADKNADGQNDNLYTITFTEHEGDVGHVTATAEQGNLLRDPENNAAKLLVEKVSDGYVFYDESTKDEEADMLSDDVAVGTVINVTSSEVVEFIVREQTGTDSGVTDATFTFTFMGEESATCTKGSAGSCQTALRKLPGLQYATATEGGTSSTATVADELLLITVTLPKGVDGSTLSARATGWSDKDLFVYTHRWRNNNGRSFTVLKARENRIGALKASSSVTAVHDADATAQTLTVTFDNDVYVAAEIAGKNIVAVHNTHNVRISAARGAFTNTVGTNTVVKVANTIPEFRRGDVYTVNAGTGTFAGVIDQAVGKNKVVPLFCLQDCGYTAADDDFLKIQGNSHIAFSGTNTKANAVIGSSDTFHLIPDAGSNAEATTGAILGQAVKAQFASSGDSDAYSNAYVGMGGDELYVDSVPDALYGTTAIAMDITYTGPSGSCSVSEVTKGSKESAVCSNRGVCDYETGTCVCAEGFTKEACSEQSVLV